MEKQILEIIRNNHPDQSIFIRKKTAKEIASLFGEFIEWFAFGSHPFIAWYENDNEKFFSDEVNDKKWTLDELFEYWFNNIKT